MALSIILHAALITLLALAPGFRRIIIPKERVIPINFISIPSPTRVPEVETPAPLPKKVTAPPAKKPKVKKPLESIETVGKSPEIVPEKREIVVPEIVSKIKPVALPDISLKEKVQERLKIVEPVPEPSSRISLEKKVSTPVETPAKENNEQYAKLSAPRVPATTLTLEAGNFPYAWYVAIVQNKIYENWSPPQRLLVIKKGAAATIKFRIESNGTVSDIVIQESSGYTMLDRSAIEAVKRVIKLPPLPVDFKKEYLNVVVCFHPDLH